MPRCLRTSEGKNYRSLSSLQPTGKGRRKPQRLRFNGQQLKTSNRFSFNVVTVEHLSEKLRAKRTLVVYDIQANISKGIRFSIVIHFNFHSFIHSAACLTSPEAVC